MQPVAEIREFMQSLFRHVGMLNKDSAECDDLSVIQSQIIYELGKHDGFSLMDLSNCLLIESSSLSRHVQSLVERALVSRYPDPKDRRYVVLSLTPAGVKTRESVSRVIDERVEQVWNAIPLDERENVLRCVHVLSKAITETFS
ncbi:MarR family winged helix-turn-helix transcriptional regulator [Ferroacidibacillus organovorans]|uniref:HTH marR-type domain-containing protein n=1 Tax=Ferroacidibacillus organovorans TaxID=1765683 RepID=A0A853KBV8_9BACL|nr:MarR family winged helix-turn-helix transcriptional regulator [Ferroacidibacillus organovorans]KYP79947.1 hypothetical protein AYJ22_03365 [Ferroacidibacillus organovorans]OAG94575.1 hypothetical protein AYW79_04250 [Ferroacidibacillus organovorans]